MTTFQNSHLYALTSSQSMENDFGKRQRQWPSMPYSEQTIQQQYQISADTSNEKLHQLGDRVYLSPKAYSVARDQVGWCVRKALNIPTEGEGQVLLASPAFRARIQVREINF